jgi:PST family polysaccharide transporter
MNLKKQAVKGVVWSVLESWGRRIFTYIVFFLLARLLKPEDFGLIALATTFVSFANIFVNQGFTTALIQREKLDPEHLDTAFWTNLALGFVFTLISIVAAGLIANLYKQPQLKLVIAWLSVSFLINAFKQVQEAILTRRFCFKVLAIRSLTVTFVGGIAGIVAAVLGLGVWSLVIQQLVGETLGVIVLWQASNWRPRFKFSIKHWQELFSFGINLVGISLLSFITTNSDNLLIGYFLGPVELGYYALGYKIYQLILQLLSSITDKVALPVFARMQTEIELLRNTFYRVTQLTSLFAFPVCFGVIILAPELVPVVFGEKWLPSIPIMQILGFVGVLHCVYQYKVTVITAMGKPSWNLWMHFLNSILDVIAFTIAVHWGIIAVATAYVIRNYLVSPIRLWMVCKLINITFSEYCCQYVAPLLGSLGMIFSVVVAKFLVRDWLNSQVTLIISVMLGIGVYILIIRLVAPSLFKKTINLIQSALPKSIWSKASI